MAKLKIYGVPGSRAMRVYWMAQELGLDYESVPIHFGDGSTKKPDYLAINPNGRVPAIDDNGLKLFESLAINLYLAKKYGAQLYPKSIEDEARAIQWSIWAMTEIEPLLISLILNRVFLPEAQRNPALADEAEKKLAQPLKVLNDALTGRDTLLGGSFSVADLNVAAVLSMSSFVAMKFDPYGKLDAWLTRTLSRPAFLATRKLAGM